MAAICDELCSGFLLRRLNNIVCFICIIHFLKVLFNLRILLSLLMISLNCVLCNFYFNAIFDTVLHAVIVGLTCGYINLLLLSNNNNFL